MLKRVRAFTLQLQPAPERTINGDVELTTASHAGGRLPRPQQQARTYPDILDIAGMDYSPATRKPPIHN